jgi:hypothetical protein
VGFDIAPSASLDLAQVDLAQKDPAQNSYCSSLILIRPAQKRKAPGLDGFAGTANG